MSRAGQRGNFSGDLSLTAPTGGVTAGLFYEIEDVFTVARETADADDSFLAAVDGPVYVSKDTDTGDSFAAGDKIYADATSKKATPTATGNSLVGYALEAADVADTFVLVSLKPLIQDLA